MDKGFRGCHPAVNIIYFAGIIVFGMIFKHPVTIISCFSAAVWYYIKLNGKAAVKSFFFFLLPTLLLVLAINGLFSHYGITTLCLLPWGGSITLESIVYGFLLGMQTVTVIMWFFCCNEVVTTDKFMCVFGKIIPSAALVFSMTLRFIPLYRKRLHIIAEAQQGIGTDYKSGNPLQRIKNGVKIISILITWSLESAVDTADSMRAKGYGLKGKSSYGRFRLGFRDTAVGIIIIVLFVFLIYGWVSQSVLCVYNPCITVNPSADFGKTYIFEEINLTLNPVSATGIITLIAFSLLCFLPIIIDIKEDIKWRRLKLKI